MLLIFIMKILKNLFGPKTKLATDNIADETGRLLSQSVIVDSGSNANGRWIKYADGTMICYYDATFGPASTQSGGLYVSLNFEWIFPQPFINGNVTVSDSVKYGYGSVWTGSASTNTNGTKYAFRLISIFEAATTNIGVGMIAIGSWK